MITDFACEETERIWEGFSSKKFPADIQQIVRRKLRYLHYAKSLNDLRSPPGNRLEALKGNRKGQFSIRINNQWRLCFVWVEGDVMAIEMVDYH